jgi:UDP-glucose 4-epimerase
MNVLVTGGAGYIGSHTTVELLNAGHSVVCIDNLMNSKYEAVKRVEEITGKKVKFYEGDIRDRKILDKIFTENKIDIMIEDCVEAIIAQSKYTKHFCYDTRYNRDFTLKGTKRVFSWYDIYRNIKEME